MKVIRKEIEKYLSDYLRYTKEQERLILSEVEELIVKAEGKNSLRDFPFPSPPLDYPVDRDSTKEMEGELISSVEKMKEYATLFNEYLVKDRETLQKLSNVQKHTKKSGARNLHSLMDFEKLSKNLGFFRLLKMGLISSVLFVATLIFIWVDTLIFS